MRYQNMSSEDEGLRSWRVVTGSPPPEPGCPVCAMPLLRYENPQRWLCFSVTVHDVALGGSLPGLR